jgi:membrane protein
MRRTFNQLRVFLESNPYTAAATMRLSRRARAAIFVYRLSLRILAQWARDKCPQQAAALAYQTALGLVPVTAITFSVLRAVGSLDAESRLLQFFSEHIFPRMSDVTERIQSFAGKVSIGALGGGGLIFTIVTCYSLYATIERIFNDIWRVGQRRTLIGKFLTFNAMVMLLPTLAGFSLYWSGRLIESDAMTRFFAPFMIELLALMMMNKLLPRTDVDWWAAAAGALATAGLLELTKLAFVRFAEQIMLKSYASVYGPLGLVPLVLVWIYTAWVLVLLGAEITHALQNLRLLEAEDRRQRDDEPINGLLAAQILAAVAATYEAGGAGHSKERLVSEFGLTPHNVERVVHRLKTRGLIAEVRGDLNGYVPGRAAAAIPLDEVLAAFRSADIEIAHGGATSAALQKLVDELDEGRRRRIAGLTIADLLPAVPSGATTPPTEGAPREGRDASAALAIVPPPSRRED